MISLGQQAGSTAGHKGEGGSRSCHAAAAATQPWPFQVPRAAAPPAALYPAFDTSMLRSCGEHPGRPIPTLALGRCLSAEGVPRAGRRRRDAGQTELTEPRETAVLISEGGCRGVTRAARPWDEQVVT